jgi:hypothetical protein
MPFGELTAKENADSIETTGQVGIVIMNVGMITANDCMYPSYSIDLI